VDYYLTENKHKELWKIFKGPYERPENMSQKSIKLFKNKTIKIIIYK
jgi:hypothetical protein